MNERDFRANTSEGLEMLNTHTNYRRAFWIVLATTVVLAAVASLLWWRLDHATRSQSYANSEAMQAMTQNSSASASDSESGSAGGAHTGNMQETPLAPIRLTPQRMQSIGIVLGKVESKQVNSELRFYGNVQIDERRQAYVQTRFAGCAQSTVSKTFSMRLTASEKNYYHLSERFSLGCSTGVDSDLNQPDLCCLRQWI
jgi:hypothetical protein